MTTTTISRYSYYLNASGNDAATVFLYGDRSEITAKIHFVEASEVPLPVLSGRPYVLYYRRPMLSDVIDMLRNEGPVYLTVKDDQTVALSTGYEGVGEGE